MPQLSDTLFSQAMIAHSLRFGLLVRWVHLIFVICLALAVSGCSVVGSDSQSATAERTLPGALDARRVSLEDARRGVATPDTVNLAVHVVDLAICPERHNCLLPDGIIIAERPDPSAQEDTRRIAVDSPRQFTEDRRYLVSIRVTAPSDRNADENLFDIIGYSGLES